MNLPDSRLGSARRARKRFEECHTLKTMRKGACSKSQTRSTWLRACPLSQGNSRPNVVAAN